MSRSNVLLLITGSIAAYKACQVVSRLTQAGCNVQVAASPSALQFVGAATWEGLSGNPVVSDLFEPGRAMDHIHLVRKADVILAAPASAHFMNRAAHGVGDDLLTTMFLAHDFKKPFLMAPAMNTAMYLHPATQESLKRLRAMGVEILETASGVLACGENGYGRLLDPDLIQAEVMRALKESPVTVGPRAEKTRSSKILITAGGTREAIDDVRFITNGSSGVSGARLAETLSELGYEVILLRSKNGAKAGADVQHVEFDSYKDLENELRRLLDQNDVSHIVHAAAVSDYTVDRVLLNGQPVDEHKTPSGEKLTIELKPTPKLIANLKYWSRNKDVKIAGFKLTSHASIDDRKAAVLKVLAHSDVVIANDLSEIDDKKGIHPYRIWNKRGDDTPVAGLGEMSAWVAQWITEKEVTK